MAEVTIKKAGGEDQVYKTGRLDARKQYHVARKIAPALFSLQSARARVRVTPGAESDQEVEDVLVEITGAVARALSEMKTEDADYIIDTCLSVCERKQAGGWQKVLHSNGHFLFDDLGVTDLIQLSVAVIRENLGSFFAAPLGDMK